MFRRNAHRTDELLGVKRLEISALDAQPCMTEKAFWLQPHLAFLDARLTHRLAMHASGVQEFRQWQLELRREIVYRLGLAERAPMAIKADRLGAIDRGAFVEEKYSLQVGERAHAPMYVLVPKRAPPFKTILVFHGHDASAQYILGNFPDQTTAREQLAADNNYAQALANAGYLIVAVEQRGLGERKTDQVSDETPARSCRHLAFEYLLRGRTLIGERCWDGMCAIDYLQTRSDVIRNVLGCTGHSGGGTTALWLSAIESRITAVVVSGYFCSFKDSILAMDHCECNYVPGILSLAEMGDLAALVAPRPFRAVNGETDPIFPVRAARQQFATVERAYSLLDMPDRCSLAVHPGAHAYNHRLSQEWFAQWL